MCWVFWPLNFRPIFHLEVTLTKGGVIWAITCCASFISCLCKVTLIPFQIKFLMKYKIWGLQESWLIQGWLLCKIALAMTTVSSDPHTSYTSFYNLNRNVWAGRSWLEKIGAEFSSVPVCSKWDDCKMSSIFSLTNGEKITLSITNLCFLWTHLVCQLSCPLLTMSIVLQRFWFGLVVGGQRRRNELPHWGRRTGLAELQPRWLCKLCRHRQLILALPEVDAGGILL